MLKLNCFLGLLVIWSVPCFGKGPGLFEIWENNQAVSNQSKDKKIEAFDQFAQLIAKDPFNALYQFNMGTGFLTLDEKEKAKKMFTQLAKTAHRNPQIAFASYYNLGVLAGLDQDIDGALEHYQMALNFVPNSKEVKTNIELLLQGGKGKGKGKNKDKDQKGDPSNKDEKDGEGEKEPKEPQEFTNKGNQKKQPKMSKEDVKKILGELRKQEERIRAKHDRKGSKKEQNRDKAW